MKSDYYCSFATFRSVNYTVYILCDILFSADKEHGIVSNVYYTNFFCNVDTTIVK